MTYLTSVAGGIADGGSTTHDSPTLTVSGTNKVMWVLAGNSDSTPADPSGVAWDPTGVNEALTLQGSGLTFGTYGNASLWRLIAPSDGTAKAVRVTWAASKGERYVVVWVENDIDQATPNGTVASATGTTTAISAGAVSTSVGQRVLMFAGAVNPGTFSSATPYGSETGTERQDGVTSGTAYDAFAAQEETASGASTTPAWTLVETLGSGGFGAFAFAVNVAAAAADSPPQNDTDPLSADLLLYDALPYLLDWAVNAAAIASMLPASGTMAAGETADSMSAAGRPVVVASMAASAVNDTMSAAGSPIANGTASAQNQDDTMAASGSTGSAAEGTMAASGANDSMTASGTPVLLSTCAAQNQNDTMAADGWPVPQGSMAAQNLNDVMSANGTAGPVVSGQGDRTKVGAGT